MLQISNYLKLLLLCTCLCSRITLFAQTPGGIPSSPDLWLKAGDLSVTTNTMGNWGSAIYTPGIPGVWYEVQPDINANNSVHINDEWFEDPLDLNVPNLNVFVVYRLQAAPVSTGLWGNGGLTAGQGKQATTTTMTDGAVAQAYSNGNTLNKVYINHININNGANSFIWLNGTQKSMFNTGNTNTGLLFNGTFIGRSDSTNIPNSATNHIHIAEYIAYREILTTPKRERINSYLAIKYGITLPHDYTINNGTIPIWNQATNSGYTTNITAIASDNGSGLNQTSSKSENPNSILTLIATSAIANHQGLAVGDNGGSISNATAFQVNNNFFAEGQRLNKVWKCQKTAGFNNNLQIKIDIGAASLPSGFNNDKLVLLVSSDPNFSNPPKTFAIARSGSVYTASDVQLNNGDYFTIAHSTNGAMWIKADGNNLISTNLVNKLNDHVLGTNEMTGEIKTGTSSTLPIYTGGNAPTAINYNPYITFNQGNSHNYIKKSNFVGLGNVGASSFLVVRRENNPNSSAEALFSYATNSQDNEWLIHRPINIRGSIKEASLAGHNSGFDIRNNVNRPHLVSNMTGDSRNNELRSNGNTNTSNYKNATIIDAGGTLILGQEQDILGGNFENYQEYEGDFAEAIVLNKRASNNERNAIESYLAVKYGITLATDYKLSNNNITWDINANNMGGGVNYNNNITGIGRDDVFQLDQQKSKSQNGNNVHVVIEHPGAFPSNLSHLIWGCNNCGDYDNISSTNAPPYYKISEKQWKVQNTNVGNVDITLEIPSSLSSHNAADLKLLVSDNTNFSIGSITDYGGNISGNEITFSGVSLPNNHYFTLGIVENISYVNNDPGSPKSFEACAGSNVTFQYAKLNAHPTHVQLRDTTGAIITVAGTVNQISNAPYNGDITIVIPDNAATGNVMLLNGNSVVYDFNTNLVIHNPQLDFFPQASPVCATDIVPLIGFPHGGTFSSPATLPNLVSNGAINGSKGNWSNLNDGVKIFPITYSYTPYYLDGTSTCFSNVSRTKNIEIRDNRINELTFNYIIKDSASSKQLLDLDAVTINSISPDLLDPSFNFPVSFSGTYVDSVGAIYEFLTGLAASNNPVILSYNNGGCIGKRKADIDVFPRLRIIGLLDTMCIKADSILFGRDTLSDYAHSITTINKSYPNYSVSGSREVNKITKVITQNPAYQIAIDSVNTANNMESYRFTPTKLPLGANKVIVEMHYTSTTTQTITINSSSISITSPPRISNVIAFDTIYMIPRPVPSIGGLDNIYCENAITDTLQPSPFFESSSRTYFKFLGNDGLAYNILDTLLNDTLFDLHYHYSKHVPTQNRHFEIQLVYIVDRYGCFDTDTAYTTIIAPTQPIFFPQIAYCVSDFPTPLTPSFAAGSFPPTGGSGVFLPTPGLDITTNLFDPNIANPGYHEATYQFTDNFGCTNSYSDTLYVREPPQIKLEAGGQNINAFCANETDINLKTILLPSLGTLDSVQYFGAGVSNDTFNPSGVFPHPNGGPSAGGSTFINNLYTDSFGCAGRDTLSIIIREIPRIRIDSFFNASQRYCGNDPQFFISGLVLNSFGQFVTANGNIVGSGVTLIDTTYYYDPNIIAVDSVFSDTVRYNYTDIYGCSNSVNININIDSIPELTFTGLDTSYCINYPSEQLFGFPDNSSPNNRIVYGGPGIINPNTGSFDPATSGTGQKIISYTFEDQNLCSHTVYDTTIVHSLPIPLFGDYLNQYCSAAPNDTLSSLNNLTTGSRFRFWSRIIVDSTGILDPGNDSTGVFAIYYAYTDSLGCSNTDSANIFIHPSPEVIISGLDSAYCFKDPEDNIATFPPGGRMLNEDPGFSLGSNNIIFDPDEDTAGLKVFTYIYTDPNTTCADTVTGSTFVRLPPTPSFSGLDTFYCETRDTFPIVGTPLGGIFSGQGIVDTFGFNPAKAGGGLHAISYLVNDTFFYGGGLMLVCPVDTITNIRVRPLPVPTISSPGNNQRFCDIDTSTLLVSGTPDVWDLFKDTTGGVIIQIDTIFDSITYAPLIVVAFDTTYYFSPNVDEGTHFVTYIATNAYGCKDSVQYTYIVDEYNQPRFALDSVYCESDDPIILFGVPGGGTFTRDDDTLSGAPPFFSPNPNYGTMNLPAFILDTIIYTVQDGACYGTDTQIVRVNPVPILSFTGTVPHNIYCKTSDTINLTPNILGGTFSGHGVPFESSVFISRAAGHHEINYDYQDPNTGCRNTAIDTFSVFGMPDVSFQAIGGCQSDSILFLPDNTILGLGNIFNNQIIDSITSIRWEFTDTDTLIGSSQNNEVDSVYHVFGSPGIYNTKLYVANQIHCIDTHNVRLVISPTKIPTKSSPYDESFENSNGNWYAESRDNSHGLLWEWGIDSTAAGIPSNKNNNLWVTQSNSPYSESEDAWVYSPCFDISQLDRPMLKLDYWSDTRSAIDGTVLEYQKADGSWEPLGLLNRGINWYNSPIITGQPGDQDIAPIGWSGQSTEWTDARYRLDEFKENDVLRLRFAFGSPSINLNGSFYDGFGFDNVWIGNRTRNVLLETTSNINEPNMEIINFHVYHLVSQPSLNKDLVLLQYQCKEPINTDVFYLDNPNVGDTRVYFYSGPAGAAGKSFIDGRVSGVPPSRYLQNIDFEKDMLESPKFSIEIRPDFAPNQNNATIRAVAKALVDMPEDDYYLHMVISEDSLTYPSSSSSNGSTIHAVARKDDNDPDNYVFKNKTWGVGDSVEMIFTWNHNPSPNNYNPSHFQAVVFMQSVMTKEVFQVATSRNTANYWVGVDQIKATPELKEVMGMNLYPNPADNYFRVDFEKELSQDYKWKLVDLKGVEVRSGIVAAGTNTLEVNNYDLPTGVYIFMVSNNHVFAQKKVVINQN